MRKSLGKFKVELVHTFSGDFREDFEISFVIKSKNMSYGFSIPREEIDMLSDPNEAFFYHCARGMKEFVRQAVSQKTLKTNLTKLKVVK